MLGVYKWIRHVSLGSVSVPAFILELWAYHVLLKIFRYIRMSSGYKTPEMCHALLSNVIDALHKSQATT